jgi:glycosyltransferase involved in cell wall biosynthesis
LISLKGVRNLVEAVARARGRGLDLTLVLAGPADPIYLDLLKTLVRNLSIAPWVVFAGYISEPEALLRLYRQADVFALATESEGFPRVLYEAMSQGLPVVATSIPAIAQSLTAGREALLVPPGSAQAMAEAIENLVRDPELRRSVIAHGRAFAQSRIASRTTAQQILELLGEHFPPWKLSGRLEDWARE